MTGIRLQPAAADSTDGASIEGLSIVDFLRAKIATQANRIGSSGSYFSALNNKAEALHEIGRCVPLGRNTCLDRLLAGGLQPGTLTEILGSRPADAWAASGFLLALAIRFAVRREKTLSPVIWIREEFAAREQGEPYGPGLALHGFDPARLVLVTTPGAKEALWAIEEALKCKAPAVVIGELWSAKPYDLIASRRLLLAARKYETPGLLFLAGSPGAAGHLSSGADLRFEIRAHPSVHPPSAGSLPLPGAAAWSVRIAKARGAGFGIDRDRFHTLIWDNEEALLRDALPLALASGARDGSDRPALAWG